tara:strand:+ start:8453 stop:9292 length:840 start_codon:yes stop_codon:yes gene_type:complete
MNLIPDIKLNDTKTFDYAKAYKECFVDLDKEIERPDVVLGIGYHDYKGQQYLNPTCTKDEWSAIIAPQKSKKTFFKRALVASFIGGNAENYFPSIKSQRQGEPYILDFDTEQGKYYAQRSFKGVEEMVGAKYKNYLAFGLKKLSDDERVLFIDSVVNDPRYKGKIALICIDGIADLCTNTNDIEKSKTVGQKILEWNEGCHIITVIHKTFEKDKATGHLGTFVQKKAETTIFLNVTDAETKNSPVEVKQKDSRGAPFDTFYFDLDLTNVMPKECEPAKW